MFKFSKKTTLEHVKYIQIKLKTSDQNNDHFEDIFYFQQAKNANWGLNEKRFLVIVRNIIASYILF